jgi:myo-inositol-1(or 4)-monophosphatase
MKFTGIPPRVLPDESLLHRINAGRTALQRQINFFRSQFASVASDWKEDDSRVTFMDFAISEKIFSDLRADFPKDVYCSEESSPEDDVLELRGEFAWVLDPIDGTNNYALGIPFVSISLALLRAGMPVYGFVYDYARDKIIEGGEDQGLRIGTHPVTPLERPLSPQSVLALHFPLDDQSLQHLSPLLKVYRVRATGSAALNFAYVAAGITDACWDQKIKIWDIAAAWALLEATKVKRLWSGPCPFPLRTFHVRQKPLALAAGTNQFLKILPPFADTHGITPR